MEENFQMSHGYLNEIPYLNTEVAKIGLSPRMLRGTHHRGDRLDQPERF